MRTEDGVWRCFGDKQVKAGQKCKVRRCKGCGTEVSLVTTRARKHADECTALQGMGLWSRVQGRPMDKHTIVTSLTANWQHSLAMARFIFANNLSFGTVHDATFLTMVEKLRPGTKVPHRTTLGSTLLNQVYDEERQLMCKKTANEWLTMCIDGWTNNVGVSCIGISLNDHLWTVEDK